MLLENKTDSTLVKDHTKSERDISHYYSIRDSNNAQQVVIGFRPDTFFAAWPTNLDINQFLKISSDLIDNIAKSPPPKRPETLGNPSTITLSPDQKAHLPPSYSGLGINRLFIDSTNLSSEGLTFEELDWPLNLPNICQAAIQKDGMVNLSNPTEMFARVEGEFCSIHFNGDRWDQSFSFWSHIYPQKELRDVFQQTSTAGIDAKTFSLVLNKLINHYGNNRYALINTL